MVNSCLQVGQMKSFSSIVASSNRASHLGHFTHAMVCPFIESRVAPLHDTIFEHVYKEAMM